jgi:L-lactate dehydrogenase (cytochrome)
MTLPEIAPPSGSSSKQERKIELSEIIGIPDFDVSISGLAENIPLTDPQEAARRILTGKAWAYMSAGATDMYSELEVISFQEVADLVALDLNRKAFNWILFRPRVMVDVDVVDTSTHMLGQKTSLPVGTVLGLMRLQYKVDSRFSFVPLVWPVSLTRKESGSCRQVPATVMPYTW